MTASSFAKRLASRLFQAAWLAEVEKRNRRCRPRKRAIVPGGGGAIERLTNTLGARSNFAVTHFALTLLR